MSIRRSLLWALSGQFLSFATSFGTSIVVARLLDPHEMGIYAVAFATLGVLQMVAAFDMATYVVRQKTLAPRDLDAAFTVNALLSLGLAALTFALSFAAAAFLGEPAVAGALQLLAVGPVIGIFEFRPSAMLQRDMAFKHISIITLARTMTGAGVTIAAALAGLSYMSLAWGNVAYAAFGAIAFNLVARHHMSVRLSAANWRTIATFGLRMMSISGVANLAVRISDILLGRILGLAALGLYSRASSISSLIFQNLYGTATRIAFVQLAEDFRARNDLRTTFLRSIEMITAVMWPVLIGLAILSKPVVGILFGIQWIPAAVPLSLLLVAQFVTLAFGMNWELFVLRDETARQTRFEAARAVVSLALFAVGCTIGLAAAAASRIAEALIGLLLYLPHMNRLAGTTTRELGSAYAQSFALTVVATLPSALLMWSTGWSAKTAAPHIAAAILVGMAAWLATLALLRHALFLELRRVVARFGVGKGRI